MADQSGSNIDHALMEILKRRSADGSGGGGGSMEDVIRRVAALESGQKEILASLKEINKGITDGRIENERRYSDTSGKLIEFGGKLTNLGTIIDNARKEVDKLPTKNDVTISVFAVVGGLTACATALRLLWVAVTGQ